MSMIERLRSGSNLVNPNVSAKMSNDLTPRKTMLILVIVVGCFAVLWPKVFYPMLVGSANQHIKPSPIDKTTGCCDVISEIDVNTIKIMSELCKTIIKKDEDLPLTGREIVAKCQSAVLETCGIDISAVLQEQVRLGQSVKQILDEIRSLNGSLCLKYNFGVAPWRLGVPHRVTVKMPTSSIRQERPQHLRSELVHPAFRERGRAIPQPQQVTSHRSTTRVVEGRPGPIPGMRPTLGGAGHVVPPPKQSTGSMGFIMPIYTIGIVIFFTYTVMKIIFKKQPEALYPPVEPDPNFRREVFESERIHTAPKLTREGVSSKLGDAELDQLRQRLRETELAMERIVEQMAKVPLKLQNVVANGNVPQEEQPSVKVVGLEMTASCEGGKKWSRPESSVLPPSSPPPQESVEPPQEIFLEGALPAQSHLLVADSATEAENINSEEDPAVVLAGKMTLSVISLDSSENGTDDSSNLSKKQEERSSSNVSDEFEKIEADIVDQVQNITDSVQQLEEIPLLHEIQNEIENNIISESESTIQEPVSIESDAIKIKTTQEHEDQKIFDIKIKTVEERQNEEQINSESKSQLISSKTNEEDPQEEYEENVGPITAEQLRSNSISESLISSGNSESLSSSHISELLSHSNTSDPLIVNSVSEVPESSDVFVSSVIPETELNSQKPGIKMDEDIEGEKIIRVSNTDGGASVNEKESLEKLNEAISDLSSEFRPNDSHEEEPREVLDEEELDNEDEEEIEYEYEESDDEAVDEEIRNVNRLDDEVDDIGAQERLNGENQEHSKYGTTSSATLAENDISDQEILENENEDDEEVEEIIEYITDEDEDEQDNPQLAEVTTTNHISDHETQ